MAGDLSAIPLLVSHPSHNPCWFVQTHYHGRQSTFCLACAAEMLEDQSLVRVKRKIAVTSLVGVLKQESVLHLILINPDAHRRLAFLLVGLLQDQNISTIAAEGVVRLLGNTACHDTAIRVLDHLIKQCINIDHHHCLSTIRVISRLLEAAPTLLKIVVHEQYTDFIEYIVRALAVSDPRVQCCMLTVLLSLSRENQMSAARVFPNLISVMVNSRNTDVRTNAISLLKSYLEKPANIDILLSVNDNGLTISSALKQILINVKPSVRIITVQCIALMVTQNFSSTTQLLNNDIAELLFETLTTDEDQVLQTVFECLYLFSQSEDFYLKHHSVYGIESILRAVELSFNKSTQTLISGLQLLSLILDKHRVNLCLFSDVSRLDHCLRLISTGLNHSAAPVRKQTVHTLTNLLKLHHFHGVVPYSTLTKHVTILHQSMNADLNALQLHLQSNPNLQTAVLMTTLAKLHQKLWQFLEILSRSFQLLCSDSSMIGQEAFMAPDNIDERSARCEYSNLLITALESACIPLCVLLFDRLPDVQDSICHLYTILSQIFSLDMTDLLSFCESLTKTGFLNFTLLVKRKVRQPIVDNVLLSILGSLLHYHVYDTDQIVDQLTTSISGVAGDYNDLVRLLGMDSSQFNRRSTSLLIIYFMNFFTNPSCVQQGEVADSLSRYVMKYGSSLSAGLVQCCLFIWAKNLACVGSHQYSELELKALSRLLARLPDAVGHFTSVFLEHPVVLWFSFTRAELAGCLGAAVLRYRLDVWRQKDEKRNEQTNEMDTKKEEAGQEKNITKIDAQSELIEMIGKNPACFQTLLEVLLSCQEELVDKGLAVVDKCFERFPRNCHDGVGLQGVDEKVTQIVQRVFLAGDKAGLGQCNRLAIFSVLIKLRAKFNLTLKPQPADLKLIHHINAHLKQSNTSNDVAASYLKYLSCLMIQSLVSEDVQTVRFLLAQQGFVTCLNQFLRSANNEVKSWTMILLGLLIEIMDTHELNILYVVRVESMDSHEEDDIDNICEKTMRIEIAKLLPNLTIPDLTLPSLLLLRSLYMKSIGIDASSCEVRGHASRLLYIRVLNVFTKGDELERRVCVNLMENLVENLADEAMAEYLRSLSWNRRLLEHCISRLSRVCSRPDGDCETLDMESLVNVSDCQLMLLFKNELSSRLPLSVCDHLIQFLLNRLEAGLVRSRLDHALARLVQRTHGWFFVDDVQRELAERHDHNISRLAAQMPAIVWLDTIPALLAL